ATDEVSDLVSTGPRGVGPYRPQLRYVLDRPVALRRCGSLGSAQSRCDVVQDRELSSARRHDAVGEHAARMARRSRAERVAALVFDLVEQGGSEARAARAGTRRRY